MERHLEKGKRNFMGWELKHSLPLSWNLRPPMYSSVPNLFKQPWFKIPRIWTVPWVLRLRSLDMPFLFRARFLHQFNNFFHLHMFYSCKIMGPSVEKNPGRKVVGAFLSGKVWDSVASLWCLHGSQSRNIHEMIEIIPKILAPGFNTDSYPRGIPH